MGILQGLRRPDLASEMENLQKTPDALLLDVRTVGEYEEGHLPDSINIPLNELPTRRDLPQDKATPLFLYCRSGARSERAAAFLRGAGYTAVTDMGGLIGYHGRLERSIGL